MMSEGLILHLINVSIQCNFILSILNYFLWVRRSIVREEVAITFHIWICVFIVWELLWKNISLDVIMVLSKKNLFMGKNIEYDYSKVTYSS